VSGPEWWELFDEERNLPYYYCPSTDQTVWETPKNAYIVILSSERGEQAQPNAASEKARQAQGTEIKEAPKVVSLVTVGRTCDAQLQPVPSALPPLPQVPSIGSNITTSIPNGPPAFPLPPLPSTPSASSGSSTQTLSGGRRGASPSMAAPPRDPLVDRSRDITEGEVKRPFTPIKQHSQPQLGLSPVPPLGQVPDIPLPVPRRYTLQSAGTGIPELSPSISSIQVGSSSSSSGPYSGVGVPSSGSTSPSFMRKVVSLRNLRKGKKKSATPEEGVPVKISKPMLADINKFQLEGYAKKYFAAQKRGIFRRRIPVTELLTFQKHPLPTSLLEFHKPELIKTAVSIFKMILMYQGIKDLEGQDPLTIAQTIICYGIREGQLRDEILCQLCKQTSFTPNESYLYKGWELIIMCCLAFPPTQDLESWFRAFLEERTVQGGKETAYAVYCRKKLDLMCQVGCPSRGRIPTLHELDKIRSAPFCPSPFCISLEEIMQQQHESHPQLTVPHILTSLCDSILLLGGCNIEGIFRIPGDTEPLYDLKIEIETGNYEITCQDANIPASLLKLWLRELSEPLIPSQFYDECLANVNNPKKAIQIIQQLPPVHQRVLSYLVRFLQIVADPDNQVKTKMTVNNLAMVFAPNFLRCPSHLPAHTVFENAKLEQAFLRTLILNLKTTEESN
jgi:hypothetical protein